MKIEYTPERGRGFVRPGETEKQQNWGLSGIKKAAPKWSRLSEQITRCAVCVCDLKHKHGDDSRYQAGGQCDQPGGRFLFAFITLGCLSRKSSSANLVGAGSVFGGICLARAFSCWREMILCKSNLRCSAKISSADRCFLLIVLTCKAMRRSTSHHGADSFYPLGSMPRCCNSLRIIRFIQAARESSPSCCCAFSIFSRKSGSKRNWNGGLPRLSFLCVDTLITPHVMYLCVMTHYTQSTQKAKPRTVGAVTGLLTTNDNESIEVAMLNHTTHPQGRDSHNLNKYIWRFIALSTAQPRVIHIVATSEQEARQQSPDGCVMVFAARIRQGSHHA